MNDIKIDYFLYKTVKNRVVSLSSALTDRKIVASRPFRGRFKSEPHIISFNKYNSDNCSFSDEAWKNNPVGENFRVDHLHWGITLGVNNPIDMEYLTR